MTEKEYRHVIETIKIQEDVLDIHMSKLNNIKEDNSHRKQLENEIERRIKNLEILKGKEDTYRKENNIKK